MKFVIFCKKETHNKISVWARNGLNHYCLKMEDAFKVKKVDFNTYYFIYSDSSYALWHSNDDTHYLFEIEDYEMLVQKMIESLKNYFKKEVDTNKETKEFNKKFKQLKKVYIEI